MRRSITVFPKLTDKEVSTIVETGRQYARAFNMSTDVSLITAAHPRGFFTRFSMRG